MKQKLLLFISAGVMLLFPAIASAHQPRLTVPSKTPIKIEEPEVSKAYYGHLIGQPQEFEISTSDSFDFYVQILVPDVSGSRKDFQVTASISPSGEELFTIDGTKVNWTKFFEPYGNDTYLQGPEMSTSGPAGTYRLKLSNPDNLGTYVLVVGKKEQFPLGEALNTLIVLPTLKQDYFGKSGWSALESPFLYGPLAVLIVIAVITAWLVKR